MFQMSQFIRELLDESIVGEDIQTIKRVRGGSINDSFFIATKNENFFMKVHMNAPPNFFLKEYQALKKIRDTNTIAVPNVIDFSDEQGKAFLLMEWIEGEPSDQTAQQLGEGVAALHHCFHSKHGLNEDTYIGSLPQQNQFCDRWMDYYKTYRLKNQLNLGIERNTIKGKRRENLERLLDGIDRLIPEEIPASYLHGDLWGGNWVVGPEGRPYLIDPSFLYGDRLFELAFTELFGGFGMEFYQAYHETYPIEDYYDDVKELYQLYYLLAHLNMFGESYGPSVDRILERYRSCV